MPQRNRVHGNHVPPVLQDHRMGIGKKYVIFAESGSINLAVVVVVVGLNIQ